MLLRGEALAEYLGSFPSLPDDRRAPRHLSVENLDQTSPPLHWFVQMSNPRVQPTSCLEREESACTCSLLQLSQTSVLLSTERRGTRKAQCLQEKKRTASLYKKHRLFTHVRQGHGNTLDPQRDACTRVDVCTYTALV